MKTILIADDNKYLRDALTLVIKSSLKGKYAIRTAKDGKEAADILDSTPVDLMLTDIEMPVMNGYELIGYRNIRCPSVEVIVMTSDASPEVMEKLGSLGIFECLEKPLHHEGIVRIVDKKLRIPARHERPSGNA
jgi:YesN/AraC family two-component response regulator